MNPIRWGSKDFEQNGQTYSHKAHEKDNEKSWAIGVVLRTKRAAAMITMVFKL